MKKIIAFCLVFLAMFLVNPYCCAQELANIVFTAEKYDKASSEGIIDKRIFAKYQVVKIEVDNKSKDNIFISNKIYYSNNTNNYKMQSSDNIFSKTKRHTLRRSILWGVPVTVLTFGFLTVPVVAGTIAYSISANGTLEDNIKRNLAKPKHLYEGDIYTGYVFIPKKYKNVSEILIKDVLINDNDSVELKTHI